MGCLCPFIHPPRYLSTHLSSGLVEKPLCIQEYMVYGRCIFKLPDDKTQHGNLKIKALYKKVSIYCIYFNWSCIINSQVILKKQLAGRSVSFLILERSNHSPNLPGKPCT